MTDRELMQQALEALEQVAEYFNADSTEAKTINALREKLAQPEQEPVAVTRLEDGHIKIDYLADLFPVGPLYAAPLQPAQPYPDNFIHALMYDVAKRDSEAQQQDYWQEEAQRYAQNAEFWRSKYESATAQQQEPVAWVCYGSASDEKHTIDYQQEDIDAVPVGTLLYTSPPQRKPLTDEERDAARWRFLVSNSYDSESVTQFHVWEHSWEPHSKTGEPTEWKQRVRGIALIDFIDRAIEQAHGITGEQHG